MEIALIPIVGMICNIHRVSANDIALWRNGIYRAKDYLSK